MWLALVFLDVHKQCVWKLCCQNIVNIFCTCTLQEYIVTKFTCYIRALYRNIGVTFILCNVVRQTIFTWLVLVDLHACTQVEVCARLPETDDCVWVGQSRSVSLLTLNKISRNEKLRVLHENTSKISDTCTYMDTKNFEIGGLSVAKSPKMHLGDFGIALISCVGKLSI